MKNSDRQFVLKLWLAATLLISVAGKSIVADDDEDAAADLAAAARNAAATQFDQAIFGTRTNHSMEATKVRLNQILARRIQAVDRCCELNNAQKMKLELAGRRTFEQLFQSIEEQKRALLSGKPANLQNVFTFIQQSPEMSALIVQLRSAPLGDETLFAKTLRSVLTPEQAVKYEQRASRAANAARQISVANASDLVRIAKIEKGAFRIVWSPGGEQVGFLEFNKHVEVYVPPADQPSRVFGEGKRVVGFDFSSDPNLVAIGENSKTATIIRVHDGTEIPIDTGQSQPSVKFSPDGKTLATGGYGKAAKLWFASSGQLIREFDVGPGEGGLTPVFSPDGAILAVGHRNSTTRLFDVASGKLLSTLPSTMSHGLCFDPAGKTLAVVYVDGSLVLYDARTGALKNRVQSGAQELYSVDWSPDGSVLVTAGRDTQVTLWNANDLSILTELDSPDWVISAIFSPDGTKLLFAGGGRLGIADRAIQTWAVP